MAKKGLFVGLIPDGNRSWEKEQKGLSELSQEHLLEAYDHGAQAVKRIVEAARDARLGIFATWGLSTKNLDARDSVQKQVLFQTFERFLKELRDEWMDKPQNKAVRMVHMGRLSRLMDQAPHVVDLLADVVDHTRDRSGMILALGLDYDGLDEEKRARELWEQNKYAGGREGWKFYLDLPLQVPEMRELDRKDDLSTPVHLILRTRTAGVSLFHDNEYLHAYRNETRLERVDAFLPQLTPELFRSHLEAYQNEKMKKGA